MRSTAFPFSSVPVLETERLVLRPHRASDFEPLAAMWSDPVVVRHIGGEPSPRPRSWSRLLTYAGHWALMGFGYWAVEERATGEFVGELGFADFHRDLTPSIAGLPELGWALRTASHGKGYATEALGAALVWGEAHLEAERTVCIIDPGNAASLRVAEKIGFQPAGEPLQAGKPIRLFSRTLRASR